VKTFLLAAAGGFIGAAIAAGIALIITFGYVESKMALISTATTAVESLVEKAPGAINDIKSNETFKSIFGNESN